MYRTLDTFQMLSGLLNPEHAGARHASFPRASDDLKGIMMGVVVVTALWGYPAIIFNLLSKRWTMVIWASGFVASIWLLLQTFHKIPIREAGLTLFIFLPLGVAGTSIIGFVITALKY